MPVESVPSAKPQASSEYAQRIDRVIDYLRENLHRPVKLGELAHVACFSEFHFHRIFGAVSGETLNDFTNRQVEASHPVDEGNEGGLFWGTTFLNPGTVGDEYFMTKGYHHAKRSRGEFYLTVTGSGALILMDESRKTVFAPMSTGTLHYVPAYTAHRIANTGNSLLTVLACWPSDASDDYDVIARDGFSARLRNIEGSPALVEEL